MKALPFPLLLDSKGKEVSPPGAKTPAAHAGALKEGGLAMGIDDLSREELVDLLSDFAKRWLAHDGLWFQAVESHFGMDAAIRLDEEAWDRFTRVEGRRIKERLGLPEQAGLDGLEKALDLRLYALVNEQEAERVDEGTLRFRMKRCRVQEARHRKGLPDFPCKSVGLVEYAGFAGAIDPRIQTRCLTCPPDPHPADHFCAWEFTLPADGLAASPSEPFAGKSLIASHPEEVSA